MKLIFTIFSLKGVGFNFYGMTNSSFLGSFWLKESLVLLLYRKVAPCILCSLTWHMSSVARLPTIDLIGMISASPSVERMSGRYSVHAASTYVSYYQGVDRSRHTPGRTIRGQRSRCLSPIQGGGVGGFFSHPTYVYQVKDTEGSSSICTVLCCPWSDILKSHVFSLLSSNQEHRDPGRGSLRTATCRSTPCVLAGLGTTRRYANLMWISIRSQ